MRFTLPTDSPAIEAAGTALNIPCNDGTLLAAHVYGPSHAPRLVMSHGNGMAMGGYRTFWQALTSDFQVVTFDVRGHGLSQSGASDKHQWTQIIDDMEAVWNAVADALGSRYTLGVFHSLSAVAALGHVRRYGKRWDGLLLFDPPLMPPEGHPLHELQQQEVARLVERVKRRRSHFSSPDELAGQFARQALFRQWQPQAFEDMARAVLKRDAQSGGWVLSCSPEHEARIYGTNIDPVNWLSLSVSPVPIKLVCGDPDIADAQPSAPIGRAAALELGIDYEAVPQATHFLQIEYPQSCQAITRAFYQDCLHGKPLSTSRLNSKDRQETTMKTDSSSLPGNIVDYLFEHRHVPGEAARTFMTTPSGDVSFGNLYARTCQVGGLLKKIGIKTGDRVMLCVFDGQDFPAIFLGAMKIGAISLPLNTFLKSRDYAYYIKDSGAKAIFVDKALVPMISDIIRNLALDIKLFVTGGALPGFDFIDDAIKGLPQTLATEPRLPDDTAFWLYSSGSTGDPKGVVHTHAHIYWASELFGIGAMGITSSDVILCPPKMFFAYGLGFQNYMPLRTGARILTEEQAARPETILAKLIAHEPTMLVAVPTIFVGLIELMRQMDPAQIRRACHRLRICVSGGEVLAPSVLNAWRELTGVDILDGVGTTEMTHMFIINRPGKVIPGSCGQLVQGYTARLIDDDWNDVAPGEIGNLFAIGPTAAREYWNKPEKTAAAMRDGGVLTGDKFYQDADGNYTYVGRYDDMLRVGGIWVSPSEIENALVEHNAVLECAVIGTADEHQLIKPKAYVVLRPGFDAGDELAQGISSTVRARLAHHKCPQWIEFLPELPKTATGKIQRFKLRQMQV